jgi:hypothetical protein
MLSRLTIALFLVALAVLPGTAVAQTPLIIVDNASVFEGNAGTRLLTFPLRLSGPSATGVTGQFSTQNATFNPATSGTACTPGVDFVRQTSAPFSIAPGSTTGSVSVVICGDATVEPDELLFVILSNVNGAQCLVEACFATAVIRNDDGPPRVSINNISVSENFFGSRAASFTVSLSHPSTSNTSVNFATRNGTAQGAASCAPFITGGKPDYISRSDTLTIPPDTLSGSISITICGDGINERTMCFVQHRSIGPANAQRVRAKCVLLSEHDSPRWQQTLNSGQFNNRLVQFAVHRSKAMPVARFGCALHAGEALLKEGCRRWD